MSRHSVIVRERLRLVDAQSSMDSGNCRDSSALGSPAKAIRNARRIRVRRFAARRLATSEPP